MMTKGWLVALLALLALAGACEGGDSIADSPAASVPPGPPPNSGPDTSFVQLPDSIVLPVGAVAVLVDVMALFTDGDELEITAESTDIDVAAVDVLLGDRERATDQLRINAVGGGGAFVTITVTEPPFDPRDPRPAREQPSGLSASRRIHVTVEESATP